MPNTPHKEGWEKDLRAEFQKFADSIVWSNDDGSEKYIGVGNMADWWLDKIQSAKQETAEEVIRVIEKDIDSRNSGGEKIYQIRLFLQELTSHYKNNK